MKRSLACFSRSLEYSGALTRNVAKTFAPSAVRSAKASIRQELVEAQHTAYVKALRELLGKSAAVMTVAADEKHPDCVFIEDTAVVIDGRAFMTRPGHPSRRGEVGPVAEMLAHAGREVVWAQALGLIDGGDVLWTGSELIVGLTARTNKAGASSLSRAFPGVRVTTVPLADITTKAQHGHGACEPGCTTSHGSPLHLKSVLSLVGPGTVVVADTEVGHAVAYALQEAVAVPRALRQAGKGLSFLLVPDAEAANVVYANGRFLMRESSSFPESAEILTRYAQEACLSAPIEVDTSELAKADGALTCGSILL